MVRVEVQCAVGLGERAIDAAMAASSHWCLREEGNTHRLTSVILSTKAA